MWRELRWASYSQEACGLHLTHLAPEDILLQRFCLLGCLGQTEVVVEGMERVYEYMKWCSCGCGLRNCRHR